MKEDKFLTLTKSEMQVMNILWNTGKACDVREVIKHYDEPQPAYTTISTFMKILTTKKFVDFKKGQGKQYLYFPMISKAEYTSRVMKEMKNDFFGGSASSFLKFFVEEEKLSEEDIRKLMELINQ